MPAGCHEIGQPGACRPVSIGAGDPGGVSYGIWQLASRTGTAAAFIGSRLSKLIHAAPEIGALDRIAGAAFGVARGIFAAILFVLLMHQVIRPGEEPPEIAKSQTYPYLNAAAEGVGGALTAVIDVFTGGSKPASATSSQ